jgi:hypothetical protein
VIAEHLLFEVMAREAGAESSLWTAALRPREAWDAELVFSPLGREQYALAIESIYEGYLLHYARPRLFAPADRDTSVLLGDYLYAHGLVRLSEHGNVTAVADLAELISLCTQLRAERADREGDWAVWAATAALLGSGDPRLEQARAALRLDCDPRLLRGLAAAAAGEHALEQAVEAHRRRVE